MGRHQRPIILRLRPGENPEYQKEPGKEPTPGYKGRHEKKRKVLALKRDS